MSGAVTMRTQMAGGEDSRAGVLHSILCYTATKAASTCVPGKLAAGAAAGQMDIMIIDMDVTEEDSDPSLGDHTVGTNERW